VRVHILKIFLLLFVLYSTLDRDFASYNILQWRFQAEEKSLPVKYKNKKMLMHAVYMAFTSHAALNRCHCAAFDSH